MPEQFVKSEYAKYFDHTNLHPEATTEMIQLFCKQAIKYGFPAVCVNSYRVKMVAELLKGSAVHTCTVVGFPLGANTTTAKVFETREAVENGANEIDMVVNIGALKDKNYEYVEKDIRAVVEAAGDAWVKVIIETHALTDEEKILACQMAERCGAKFVKTCSGYFGTKGAIVEDVALMRKACSSDVQVKASTGIRTKEQCDALIAAGAVRLGSSAGPAVVEGKV